VPAIRNGHHHCDRNRYGDSHGHCNGHRQRHAGQRRHRAGGLPRSTTGGAITSSGGFNNVVDGGRVGNLYARVLALSGAYGTPDAPDQIGIPGLLNLGIYHAINLFGLLEDGAAANDAHASRWKSACAARARCCSWRPADATRTIIRLAAVDRGGYACVLLPSAGLLVMVNTPSGLPPQGSAPPASPRAGGCRLQRVLPGDDDRAGEPARGAQHQRGHSGRGAVRHNGDSRGAQPGRATTA
jgi:hypothetical protein